MMSKVYIGISGWKYEGWRKSFYPKGLSQTKELFFASREVNSIEINGSFYSLQRATSYLKWKSETPEGFIFSLKGPRFISHMKKLVDVEAPLANFFASGPLALDEKLGPILWQLPPNMNFDEQRCENFFKLLPKDFSAAIKLARHHDDHLKFPAYLKIHKNRKIRYAIEVRNKSFSDKKFIRLLRKYKIALVFARAKSEWPYIEEVTSDFIYARMHGEKKVYSSGYDQKSLKSWAEKFKLWTSGVEPQDAARITNLALKKQKRDLYVYFDNDVKVRSPFDAMTLSQMLGAGKAAIKLKKPNLAKLKIKYGPRVTGHK